MMSTPMTSAAATSSARSMTSVCPVPTESPSILLVDDDKRALEQLRQILEVNGLRCVTVLSGTDALIYCDGHRPRVVVTDLSMPGIDGRVLARWLKARDPSVPIILMTGQEITEAMRAASSGIFSAILPKPVDLDRLMSLLTELTFTSQRREETAALP
jgi:DNA-binding NtrC family response regulator